MTQSPRRRRRPALSCLDCRRRKIKCDRNDPCMNCTSSGLQCKYKRFSRGPSTAAQVDIEVIPSVDDPASTSSSHHAARFHAPLTPARSHNESRDAGADNLRPRQSVPHTASSQAQASAIRQDAYTAGRPSLGPSLHSREPQPAITVEDRQCFDQQPPTTNVFQPLSGIAKEILEPSPGQQTSLMNLKDIRHPTGNPSAQDTHISDAVIQCFIAASEMDENENSIQDPELRSIYSDMMHLLGECKQVAKSLKAWRPSKRIQFQPDLAPPLRQTADAMAKLYFRFFESTYRILHEPTFWSEYEQFWTAPDQAPLALRLKVLLVIAVGSSIETSGEVVREQRSLIHQWVYAAQGWLSGPLEKDRLTLSGIQICCLTLQARQIYSIGADLLWISVGSLVRCAMHLKLHRDPKFLRPMSLLLSEQRRRLWATIMEMNVQMALDSGLAPGISLDEFDTAPPLNVDDDMLSETTEMLDSYPRDVFKSTSLQLILLDSLPTRLSIVQSFNSLRSKVSYLDVVALSTEITKTCQQQNTFFKQNEHHPQLTAFHRNLLNYMVRRFLMPLHFPFADQAPTNPLFQYSVKSSVDAALSIAFPEPDDHFNRLLAMSAGIFKEAIRYASSVLSCELLAQATQHGTSQLLHHEAHYRDFLKNAIKELTALSIERIKMGETNIKLPVFLDMYIANAEALANGEALGKRIGESARNRLRMCLDLLHSQVQGSDIALPHTTAVTTPDIVGSDFGGDWDLNAFLGGMTFEW